MEGALGPNFAPSPWDAHQYIHQYDYNSKYPNNYDCHVTSVITTVIHVYYNNVFVKSVYHVNPTANITPV